MEFRVWVETRLDGGILERHLVAQVERPTIAPEEIGMSLEEGKSVVRQVQARMIQTQADVLAASHWKCNLCGRRQRIKDRRSRRVRTVFGVVQVSCRRFSFACAGAAGVRPSGPRWAAAGHHTRDPSSRRPAGATGDRA